MDSSTRHRNRAARMGPLSVGVVTVSDTRTPESDVNGRYLRGELTRLKYQLVDHLIVPDEPSDIRAALDSLASRGAQAVLFNGGTGISTRDGTFETIRGCLDKEIPGFGEIFRMLSYEQVGSAAMLSRATAGLYQKMVVFSTPGSPNAVQLAWEKLILPELQHLVWEANR